MHDEQTSSTYTPNSSGATSTTAALVTDDPGEGAAVDHYAQESLAKLGTLSSDAVELVGEFVRGERGKSAEQLSAAFGLLDRIGADRGKQLHRESMERASQRDRVVFVLPERAVQHTERVVGRSFVQISDAEVVDE